MTQQTIERNYTTSEQSKLLKEKGFDFQVCRFYTKPNAKIFAVDEHGRHYPIKNTPKKLYVIGENFVLKDENAIPAPEQWQVCEWLRINHGIWISVDVEGRNMDRYRFVCFRSHSERVSEYVKHINDDTHNGRYDTPQEAYSGAFDYILKKLI